MLLSEIAAWLDEAGIGAELVGRDPDVTAVTVDSREASPGALFVALRGSKEDGITHAAGAVAAGAVAVLADRRVDVGVPLLLTADAAAALEVVAARWHGEPARAMRLFAVTGTNGKTTSVALLRHFLNSGSSAGSIGTLGAYDGAGNMVRSTAGSLTTPGALDLQQTLARLRDGCVTDVAMEASSHSLHQRRLDAVSFAGAIFTNLTRDHLDYHGDMSGYGAAKLHLADLVMGDGVLSVNRDDSAWSPLFSDPRTVTWGRHADADLRIVSMDCRADGSTVALSGRFGEFELAVPLPGDFNVANAVGVVALMLAGGMSAAQVVELMDTAPQVPGRMERILDHPGTVIRDYAHTPDALAQVLATLRPLTPGRLVVLFGCGGDRDRGKRPMMGEVAARLADFSFVTSDNPRTEDPEAIINDVVAGMTGARFHRVADRRKAIAMALEELRSGDTLVLAGKGHEDYQVIGRERVHFDEREIVLELVG